MKTVNINVDTNLITGELNHIWRYIGYDECNFTDTPEGRDLIEKFGMLDDAPYYMRTHFMLCTGNCHGIYKWGSTNVCMTDTDGTVFYDWTVVDKIIDTYIKFNCKPFFELGFMPFAISLTNNMNEYKDKYSQYPPKDYTLWYNLVKSLVNHCMDKYGVNEVLTWYWELWNEPDIGYWKGTNEEFFKLYDYTEAAVHDALPDARLGGPSVTNPAVGSNAAKFLEGFFHHCLNCRNYVTDRIGTRLDYITFHIKAGGYGFDLNAKKQLPSMKKYLQDLKNGLELVKKFNLHDKEIVLSEADPDGWAAGGQYDNKNMNFRNTEYFASFVAMSYNHFMIISKEMGMDVRPLAWTFTFVGERCFEGTRAFTTQGINKAVFNLFRIYAKMGNKTLESNSSQQKQPLESEDSNGFHEEAEVSCIASTSDSGNIQIMVYSHHDDWDMNENFDIKLVLNGVSMDKTVTHYRIDKNHSNAYTEWVRQGKPDYPDAKEYKAIKERDGLELFTGETSIEPCKDGVTIGFNMPAHAISLLEVRKR